MSHSDLLAKQAEKLRNKYPDDECVMSLLDIIDDLQKEEDKAEEAVEDLIEKLEDKGETEAIEVVAVEPIEESVEVEASDTVEEPEPIEEKFDIEPEPERVFEPEDEAPASGHWLLRERW